MLILLFFNADCMKIEKQILLKESMQLGCSQHEGQVCRVTDCYMLKWDVWSFLKQWCMCWDGATMKWS